MDGRPIDRREILHHLLALTSGLLVTSTACSPGRGDDAPAELPRRKLGRTGVELPILGLGGQHVGNCWTEWAARSLVEAALEEGVRFFDNGQWYRDGKAERWVGAALRGVRKDVFLMTKTYAPETRSAESAKAHLEGSLSRLGTDYLDLWQLHAILNPEDVDRAFGKGGAMEYVLEARATGVVRYVGVTGHVNPATHLRALHHFDQGMAFDTMQLPINPIDFHQASFQREVLPSLVERGIGVLAMKTSASGALIKRDLCTVEECLRYVAALPVSVLVVGMDSVREIRENARILRTRPPMGSVEMQALQERLKPKADLSLEWYKA
jgi:aryl-alcohol dehydrogenase-like predicted oxidoreductase